MIVREIKQAPLSTVGNFDWFNDYHDTRDWAVANCPHDVVELLDAGYAIWLREYQERSKTTKPK